MVIHVTQLFKVGPQKRSLQREGRGVAKTADRNDTNVAYESILLLFNVTKINYITLLIKVDNIVFHAR